MKILYAAIIFISVFFNAVTQSLAYDAWVAGVPAYQLIMAKGDTLTAIISLTPMELGRVSV